ncbi:MAG: rod shape-determining protein MreC [Verrucomicrobiae bacterium]|nr:rod shape-determining protein MreC [Verrucomicrobiae bacterium]
MRKRSLLAAAGLLVVLLVITRLEVPFALRVKDAMSDGFIPFMEATTRLYGGVQELSHRTKRYAQLQVENTDLRRRLSELSSRVAQVGELERENREFRLMLDFKNRSEFKLVPAKIVERDPSNWWNSVLVDRGAADGITRDLPVLTIEGLVGKVVEVMQNHARVLLIVDENCKVSAWLKESGYYGIVQGNALAGGSKAQCRMLFVDRFAQLKPNDKVYTSGLGGVFPKGILIGSLAAAEATDDPRAASLYQSLAITPAVDLARMDEVFIGVGIKPQAAPAALPASPPVKPRVRPSRAPVP